MQSAVENQSWRDKAECAKEKYKSIDFFSQDPIEKNLAKNICFSCPVRSMCLKYALDSEEIDGIWGGADENEIRRTLSLDAEHKEVRRGRYPQCLNCGARTSKLFVKIVDLPNGGRWTTAKAVECSVCGFDWRSRPSANAVTAYHTERAVADAKQAKKAAEKAVEAYNVAHMENVIAEDMEVSAEMVYRNVEASGADASTDRLVWMAARKEARITLNKLTRASERVTLTKQAAQEAQQRAKSSPTSAKLVRPGTENSAS